MRVIDLFCGCGGLSKGFENAGYNIVAAFDNWNAALKVYAKNFPDHPAVNYDLADFKANIEHFTQFQPEMIIGGPPCQDFSSAGKRDETLGRASLTSTFAQIVSAVRPKWFVMENVERAVKSRFFEEICNDLRNVGYGLTIKILDASLCGVPQIRKRLFLVGELGGSDAAIGCYLDKNLAKNPMTLRDYFGDSLGIEHYYRHPRSYQRRAIFSIDEPSPTIRGVNRPIPANYVLHPGDVAPISSELRPLTTKERSLIQTFPSEFWFEGTKAEVEQMIGNAVPIKLAEYVASSINDYILNGSMKQSIAKALTAQQLHFDFAVI